MKTLAQLVEPSQAAVLVVDVQNDYCAAEGALGKGGVPTGACLEMIPRLARFLDAARDSATSVIFVQTVHEDATDSQAWSGRGGGRSRGVCRKGTWGGEFTVVSPRAGEPVVVKHRYSAFINTRLESVLRTLRAQTLIMTGVSTNVCVESTARHGFMLDYDVVFLSDCTAAYTQAEHDMALQNIAQHFGTVATSEQVADAWRARSLAGV